jgi:hypothetical protein
LLAILTGRDLIAPCRQQGRESRARRLLVVHDQDPVLYARLRWGKAHRKSRGLG